jgi:hypothetical protein
MERYSVGLDVHSRESVFAIKRHDGELVARGTLSHDRAGSRAPPRRTPLATGDARRS